MLLDFEPDACILNPPTLVACEILSTLLLRQFRLKPKHSYPNIFGSSISDRRKGGASGLGFSDSEPTSKRLAPLCESILGPSWGSLDDIGPPRPFCGRYASQLAIQVSLVTGACPEGERSNPLDDFC